MFSRPCAVCGERLTISLPYSKQYIFKKSGKKGKWYHIDCFIDEAPGHAKNIASWVKKTEAAVEIEVPKDDVEQLLLEHYNIGSIPSYISSKLESIYSGTYHGIAPPIPPSELHDILVRNMDYLDRVAAEKNLSSTSRISFDLTVVANKYQEYKKVLADIKAKEEAEAMQRKNVSAFSNAFQSISHALALEDSVPKEYIDYEETID